MHMPVFFSAGFFPPIRGLKARLKQRIAAVKCQWGP